MKTTPKSTNIVLVAALVILIGYEALTIVSNTQSTISEALWRASFETPMVGLAWGILTGHIFGPKSKCVHCGLRAWAKVDDGRFGALLRRYYTARGDGMGHVSAMNWARGTIGEAPAFKEIDS